MRIKPIAGYADYWVTDTGFVINVTTGKLLAMSKGSHGYLVVSLNRKTYCVHRLVAFAFCVNRGYDTVNHIDEVRTNNHYLNLEWCTQAHNVAHSTAKEYVFTSPEGEVVVVYNLSKFARDNNLNGGHMSMVFSGIRKSHKGWSLAKEDVSQQ